MALWKSLKEQFWKTYQATIENWLMHHAHLCATVCASFAVLFLSIGFVQARLLSALSAQLVSNPTEATPHKFGGLEAFVLDGFKDKIVPSALPPNVEIGANEVDQALQKQTADVENLPLLVSPPNGPDVRSQYLSDDNKEVFLFIPAFIFSSLRNSNQAFGSSVTLSALGIPNSSLLARDISAGISARESLKKVLSASGESDANRSFTQIYLVSASGVLRDYNDGGSDNNSFIAHRFFPERPYFWPTIEHHVSEVDCPSPFSFCTRPYVDLGGHGIVVTMCRVAGSAAKISDTVLCADIGYPTNKTVETINEEVRPISANAPRVLVCHIAGANVWCDGSASDGSAGKVQKSLKSVLGSKRSEEMLGGIYKLDEGQQPSSDTPSRTLVDWIGKIPYLGKPIEALYPLKGESSFTFTVPLTVQRISDQENVSFLLCSVDFAYPTLLLTLSVIGGTFFIVGLFISIFYSSQARRKSFEFIASLEEVMKASPIPFVHLSENGNMIGANDAFQQLIGSTFTELQNQRFYSLMDQPSKARYDVIAQCRRNKLLTPPYELTLLKKSGEPQVVVVSGSALDMLRTSKFNISEPASTFLHTFGIVVPRAEMSDSEYQKVGVLSKDLSLDVFRQLVTGNAHTV